MTTMRFFEHEEETVSSNPVGCQVTLVQASLLQLRARHHSTTRKHAQESSRQNYTTLAPPPLLLHLEDSLSPSVSHEHSHRSSTEVQATNRTRYNRSPTVRSTQQLDKHPTSPTQSTTSLIHKSHSNYSALGVTATISMPSLSIIGVKLSPRLINAGTAPFSPPSFFVTTTSTGASL